MTRLFWRIGIKTWRCQVLVFHLEDSKDRQGGGVALAGWIRPAICTFDDHQRDSWPTELFQWSESQRTAVLLRISHDQTRSTILFNGRN